MDKRKLIAQTATKSKYPKWEVTKITDILLENIFEALRQGEEICINGFGPGGFAIIAGRKIILAVFSFDQLFAFLRDSASDYVPI